MNALLGFICAVFAVVWLVIPDDVTSLTAASVYFLLGSLFFAVARLERDR